MKSQGSANDIAINRAIDEVGREISHVTERIEFSNERRAALYAQSNGRV